MGVSTAPAPQEKIQSAFHHSLGDPPCVCVRNEK